MPVYLCGDSHACNDALHLFLVLPLACILTIFEYENVQGQLLLILMSCFNSGIDRRQLVALSLLFGCDYCDGVHGIGVKTAMKLLKETEGSDILQR